MARASGDTKKRIIRLLVEAEEEGQSPRVQDIAAALSISGQAVSQHIGHLEDQKLIRRALYDKLGSVTDAGRTWAGLPQKGIPVYGAIAAGFALPWDVTVPEGYVQIPTLDPQQHMAFRVRGESMLHHNICDGDIVVVRKVETVDGVKNGDIVAVAIPEDTDVSGPAWPQQLILERKRLVEQGIEPDLNYITLKRFMRRSVMEREGAIESADILLEGREWNLAPSVLRFIGVLVQLVREY